MTVHISLDIETLGREPGCVILSIGAVAFDPRGSLYDRFSVNISPMSSMTVGFTTDPETVEWWSHDDLKAARDALETDQRPIDIALGLFSEWVASTTATEIWAKPPQFDCAIVEKACRMCNVTVPWDHRAPRDLRTLLAVSGFSDKDMTFDGIEHVALDDALYQARVVQAALEAL